MEFTEVIMAGAEPGNDTYRGNLIEKIVTGTSNRR
jgi:hypothetical protein